MVDTGFQDVASQIREISWYHTIEFPDGQRTPGVIDTPASLPRLDLPASFAGRSVLDIGAWDGFYSFEAARRGAARVLATDSFVWSGQTWGSKRGFELARSALGHGDVVEDRLVDVMDLHPGDLGTFDVVLFLGVLYHLKDPVGALERVAAVCDDLLVLETECSLDWLPGPAARIYPGAELNGDPSNWFSFNAAALLGLLRHCGFTDCRVAWRTALSRRIVRTARSLVGEGAGRDRRRSGRVIIHARKR